MQPGAQGCWHQVSQINCSCLHGSARICQCSQTSSRGIPRCESMSLLPCKKFITCCVRIVNGLVPCTPTFTANFRFCCPWAWKCCATASDSTWTVAWPHSNTTSALAPASTAMPVKVPSNTSSLKAQLTAHFRMWAPQLLNPLQPSNPSHNAQQSAVSGIISINGMSAKVLAISPFHNRDRDFKSFGLHGIDAYHPMKCILLCSGQGANLPQAGWPLPDHWCRGSDCCFCSLWLLSSTSMGCSP